MPWENEAAFEQFLSQRAFLQGVTIAEGGNLTHAAIFTPRSAVLPEPVMTLQPVNPKVVVALDIAPSQGATAQSQNGFAWIDICDGPVQSAVTYIGTSLRMGNGNTVTSIGTVVGDLSTRKFGGASARPLVLCADWNGSADPQVYLSPTNGAAPAVILGANGNDVIVGTSSLNTALLATSATKGFLFIPTMNGAPTGTPSNTRSNATAMVWDSSVNKKLMVYDQASATWKGVALT